MNLGRIQAVKARVEEIRHLLAQYSGGRSESITLSKPCSFQSRLMQAMLGTAKACPSEFVPLIERAASKYGLDPAVIKAIISVESGFNPNAVSKAGARGLMQLMPSTARLLGVDPDDPEQNVDGGARYFRQQLDRFGSIELALAAYNAGPANVLHYGGIPPFPETQRYVADVLSRLSYYATHR